MLKFRIEDKIVSTVNFKLIIKLNDYFSIREVKLVFMIMKKRFRKTLNITKPKEINLKILCDFYYFEKKMTNSFCY